MYRSQKVSTQNERFLRPSHVHALTPANSNRSYGADHHHHHGAHHPLPRGAALPRQHRLPLGPVQQERHGCRHRGQLEAGLGHQQWTARVWKGNLPGGLSGTKGALRLKIFLQIQTNKKELRKITVLELYSSKSSQLLQNLYFEKMII